MSLFKKQQSEILTADSLLVLHTANTFEIDEFEVFTLAYEGWFGQAASFKDIEVHFYTYKSNGSVPHWVRNYCRSIVSFNTAKALSVYVNAEDRTGRVLRQLILGLCVVLSSIILMNTF